MKGLEFVKEIADRIATLEKRKRAYIVRTESEVRDMKAKLDQAIIAAVDIGGFNEHDVSQVAGYSGNYAVRKARRREKERRIEVR